MTPEVRHSLEKPDLFEKFKAQLYRDYELSGFSEHAPKITSNSIEHVYDEVLNSVLIIERRDSNGIRTLLYRIDITENQLKKATQDSPNNFKQVLA